MTSKTEIAILILTIIILVFVVGIYNNTKKQPNESIFQSALPGVYNKYIKKK
jgi:hypothetical protein